MTLFMLDTDSIADYFANYPSTLTFIDALIARGETMCTCCVVLTEIYSGLSDEDAAKNQEFLSSLLFLPTSPEASVQAGHWHYAYARRGIQLATQDTLIAATALEHRARVVTGNLRDYPMPEVELLPLPRTQRNGST